MNKRIVFFIVFFMLTFIFNFIFVAEVINSDKPDKGEIFEIYSLYQGIRLSQINDQ